MQEEALALLFAIIADVYAGGDLLRHHPAQRRLASPIERSRVDGLASRTPHQ
jgi:hypothetical protein